MARKLGLQLKIFAKKQEKMGTAKKGFDHRLPAKNAKVKDAHSSVVSIIGAGRPRSMIIEDSLAHAKELDLPDSALTTFPSA